MNEELLVSQCSPTMAGLKTGNLFTCPIKNRNELTKSVRKLNAKLIPRGVRLLILRYRGERALVYMYRPERLKNDLSNEMALKILSQKEYPIENSEQCVIELIRRLNKEKEFPHEVGLFLGYPAEDVNGFIVNGAKYAKCVGTWKVYGDEEKARHQFTQYEICTRVYCKCYREHNSFDRLVVAVP